MAYEGPLEQFAKLYVEGPETVRSNWEACAQAAGLDGMSNKDRPAHAAIRAYKADREALQKLQQATERTLTAAEWHEMAGVARGGLGRNAARAIQETGAQ